VPMAGGHCAGRSRIAVVASQIASGSGGRRRHGTGSLPAARLSAERTGAGGSGRPHRRRRRRFHGQDRYPSRRAPRPRRRSAGCWLSAAATSGSTSGDCPRMKPTAPGRLGVDLASGIVSWIGVRCGSDVGGPDLGGPVAPFAVVRGRVRNDVRTGRHVSIGFVGRHGFLSRRISKLLLNLAVGLLPAVVAARPAAFLTGQA